MNQARLATPAKPGYDRGRRRNVPDVRSLSLDTGGSGVVSRGGEEISCRWPLLHQGRLGAMERMVVESDQRSEIKDAWGVGMSETGDLALT
jgi:hypothetical protein